MGRVLIFFGVCAFDGQIPLLCREIILNLRPPLLSPHLSSKPYIIALRNCSPTRSRPAQLLTGHLSTAHPTAERGVLRRDWVALRGRER